MIKLPKNVKNIFFNILIASAKLQLFRASMPVCVCVCAAPHTCFFPHQYTQHLPGGRLCFVRRGPHGRRHIGLPGAYVLPRVIAAPSCCVALHATASSGKPVGMCRRQHLLRSGVREKQNGAAWWLVRPAHYTICPVFGSVGAVSLVSMGELLV